MRSHNRTIFIAYSPRQIIRPGLLGEEPSQPISQAVWASNIGIFSKILFIWHWTRQLSYIHRSQEGEATFTHRLILLLSLICLQAPYQAHPPPNLSASSLPQGCQDQDPSQMHPAIYSSLSPGLWYKVKKVDRMRESMVLARLQPGNSFWEIHDKGS